MDGLHVEPGNTLTGEPVLRLSPASAEGHGVLSTEVDIGIELVRLFPSHPSPGWELSRLVGFDMPGRPTVVVVTCAQEQLSAERVRALSTTDRRAAAVSLLDALSHLAEARIVHRAITPRRLYWDGTRVVLAHFGHAVRTIPATRRDPAPVNPPWTAPEQVRGTGTVSTGDDLYSVSAILFWLFTNEMPGEAADMAARVELQSQDLRERLQDAFAEPPGRRPSLAEARRRWQRTPVVAPRPPAYEERDRAAELAFAELRRRQSHDAQLGLISGAVFLNGPITDAIGGLRRWRLLLGGVVAVVLVVSVIALMGR